MGFRGCYQPGVTPSCLQTHSPCPGRGEPRRLGSTSSFLAWEWGWNIPNEQLEPAGYLQKPLLLGSIPASKRFTCLQEIYLWHARLGHIYKVLSPGGRNNAAVCRRWIISSDLQPPWCFLPCQGEDSLPVAPIHAEHPYLPEGCRRAGAAMVWVGCAAQPALRLFPSGASIHAGGQLRL